MTLTPWHVARDDLLAGIRPLPTVELVGDEAVGLVAAGRVVAVRDQPAAAVSAMDGVAVNAAATPGELRLRGDQAAGAPPIALAPDEAVHISTGAVLPPGADAVVRREEVTVADGHVRVPAVAPGRDVRPRASELAAGRALVEAGTVVRPGHLGLLAVGGVERLAVHPAPRVAVVVTGSEVVDRAGRDEALVPDANGPTLAARLRELAAVPSPLGIVGDDPTDLAAALAHAAADADLIVVTGGTSVGRHDHLAEVLASGGDAHSWRLALRPAKPLVTGVIAGTPVVGLPGNPNAARVSFELFVRPAVAVLAGRDRDEGRTTTSLERPVARAADGRTHVVAGRLTGSGFAPIGHPDLVALAAADALALVADGPDVPAGATVPVVTIAG